MPKDNWKVGRYSQACIDLLLIIGLCKGDTRVSMHVMLNGADVY